MGTLHVKCTKCDYTNEMYIDGGTDRIKQVVCSRCSERKKDTPIPISSRRTPTKEDLLTRRIPEEESKSEEPSVSETEPNDNISDIEEIIIKRGNRINNRTRKKGEESEKREKPTKTSHSRKGRKGDRPARRGRK
jgi:hypothetical protein